VGTSLEFVLSGSTQLIHQLFYYLDEFNYPGLAGLFTPEGVWRRQGEVLVGPNQIQVALSKRSNTQRIRHVISNVFLTSHDRKSANVIAYMTAYRFDDGDKKMGPVRISQPFLISVVHAKVELMDSDWRVAEMDLVPQFEFL
jgi:hypothetical protein